MTNSALSLLTPPSSTSLPSGRHTVEAEYEGETAEREFTVFSLDAKRPAIETDDWFWLSDTSFPNDGTPVTLQVGSSAKDVHIVYSIFSGETCLESGSVDKSNELVNRKLKLDLGHITDLIPLERGRSGRIWKLKIVGTRGSFTIGKELEIRRTLSETHLYSSCFDVEKKQGMFLLHGRGWGHGVGLCQIGAAVMGEQGMTYDEILRFYYRGVEIQKWYE